MEKFQLASAGLCLETVATADGSKTLRIEGTNKSYHSLKGAIRESQHVFINNGLAYLTANGRKDLRILEVGFGTGLNAFLTLNYARENQLRIRYQALEPFPLPASVLKTLNYQESADWLTFCDYALESLDRTVEIERIMSMRIFQTAIQEFNAVDSYDLVFYDAFAPNDSPENWTSAILAKIADKLAKGGVFVTFSAKGEVKRSLRNTGLLVETLPGPPGKREMTRAIKA